VPAQISHHNHHHPQLKTPSQTRAPPLATRPAALPPAVAPNEPAAVAAVRAPRPLAPDRGPVRPRLLRRRGRGAGLARPPAGRLPAEGGALQARDGAAAQHGQPRAPHGG